MNSRRLFLAQLSRVLLGAAALGISPFVPQANAIAPLVVVAIAQAAISVASLFSHGGSGIESLLQLQVAMLNHIESELGVIEQQIQRILANLAELKEILGELPKQVVIEDNRNTVESLLARYREIRGTYEEDGGVLTPQLANELDRDLISPLRAARGKLMSYPEPQAQFFLVPTICTACFVESFAMALANTSGSDPKRPKNALRRYREWFVHVSRGKSQSSLEGTISMLKRTQLEDAKTAHDAVAAPTTTMCYTSDEEVRQHGLMWWVKHCSNDRISTAATPFPDANISKTVDEMIKKRLLQPDEQPIQVSISPQLSGAWAQAYTGNPLHPIPNRSQDLCPGTGRTLACSTNDTSARANAAALSERLTSNGLRLVSFHALQHAAERAIAFIDKLEPSLKQESVT
ncbi:septation ring formation regulator EzrA [Edaphobacter bradus]|uniref:septation ring formation regulator EzrA n=1 Tax=Edaphobacter bradus TaxID=2259016 RepID=UPI0021E07552|nr:septation ring formation regulator EzrA [Edaphobacter bradus]